MRLLSFFAEGEDPFVDAISVENDINISINSTTFSEELLKHKNEKGYVNITLQDRREADKNGNNMYAILNTYTPKDNNNNASIEEV